jgi:putative transposase
MEMNLCIEAVEEAPTRSGKPEIFQDPQRSEFTRTAFTGALLGIRYCN